MTMLGFGQRVGQVIQMAYVVEDIRASIDWDGCDPVWPFGL
jgi:hypothetical protein